jgi:hypothetical protein
MVPDKDSAGMDFEGLESVGIVAAGTDFERTDLFGIVEVGIAAAGTAEVDIEIVVANQNFVGETFVGWMVSAMVNQAE